MKRTARLSGDGLYRYELGRQWGDGSHRVLWIMLNPSTADADVDDPTIRRCISFSQREGFDGLMVGNLYALRATKPEHLLHHPDPVGRDNVFSLMAMMARCDTVIAAWGTHGDEPADAFGIDRPSAFVRETADYGEPLLCLGMTVAGHPRHPLYVRGDAPLVPFVPPAFDPGEDDLFLDV